MTHVHYKFSSKLSYDTAVFDGPHITLRDLKRQIMGREKLRAGDCDLQITNAQTKDEYTDDEGLIPKGSSVIVRRIPIIGLKSSTNSKTRNIERSDVQSHYAFGAVKAMNDQSSARAMPLFSKMANLADADVSEEDKIKVMINQSTYDSMNYSKKFGTVLPANYTCYRCGNTGHHIRNCPTSGQDKNFEAAVRLKKSTGIPRSFMVEVDDPNIKGAMLTNCGHYAIPAIHAKAYAIGKKEKPPFVSQEQIQSEEKEEPVPDELICVICHDLLSDAVVIPCCGNSYCDDCIRTSLLDSEHHICPTCSQSDVSPDTLIANKFLRQAVNTFKNERGRTKNPTATPSSVPTLLPITMQSIPQKRYQSTHSQQDPLLYNSQAADTPSSSQVCGAPPTAPAPASASNTPSMSLQPMQSHLDVSDKEAEEKTLDDSAAAAPSVLVSHKDPTAAASELIPVVDPTPEVEQPQTANVNLQQSSSGPAPGHSGPSTSWDSSPSSSGCPTGGWSESNTQQLPPSSSSTSYPPPLFPSPHFHAFLAAQQPLNSYPPGYPPATPIWTLPTPQGAPIPSLCPSTSASSIPALIPMEWYLHQRKKNEGSPHRGSTYKPSSSRSNSKSSKSKSSRSYSRSSSRSRSRSRSRSQGRSRPHSTYSNQKKPHTRSHSSRSYSYGYKRSPTPSSSSSPRVGYQSRSKSPSDHRKNSNHSRHHSKKSALSSSSSRRRGERSQREERGSERSNLYAQHANQTNSLELDRERYLQWKREYKEWCEKYFNSYVGHFHHLPPPLLSLPPSPLPQWGDSEGSRNPSNSESRNRLQGRGTARMDGCSPPSQSSSDSRSPPSQSSSDSRSTPSQSSSDSRSTPSNSSNDSRSPPSQSSSDGRSTPSEYGAQQRCAEKYSHLPVTFSKSSKETQLQERSKDDKQLIAKNLKNLSNLKQEQKNMKKHKEGKGEESSSPDAADSTDDCRKDKRRHNIGPNTCEDGTRVQDKAPAIEALESAKPLVKPDKHLYKDYERKSRDQRNLESEKGRRRSKNSDSGQDVGRQHKEKSSKGAGRLDTGRSRSPGGSKASDSRSESRKRKGEDMERSSVKAASSECLKTNIAEVPETHKGESQSPFDRKKPKTERKTWPLTERDIWEGGIKVKPQKKISININLDGKRKEENTAKTDLSYLESITGKTKEEIENTGNGEEEKLNRGGTEINKVNEKKESSRDQEGVSEEKIKPDEREARPIWEKATFRDEEREVWEKKDAGEKKQDKEEEVFDMWHCALRGVEEESKKQSEEQAGMEAEKGEEVTNDERRTARGGEEEEWKVRNDSGGQEMGALVTGTQKERAEGESTCKENRENLPRESKPNEELMKGMKWRKVEEGDMTRSKSQRSRDESRHDRPDTTVEDGSSCEDHQESKMVVNTQDMAADGEDELILIQVPRSKWDKEESVEEEQDEGEIKVQTEALAVFRSSSSVSVTAETPPNRETEGENERQRQRGRDRAREKNNTLSSSHRSVAPSSGKDRTDSIFSAERKMEMERPRDREREREKQRQKGSKRSEERKREGERGRDMERERGHSLVQKRNPPSSSHSYSYSTSHDTERRDRQRGGDQGSNKSSSCPSGKSSSGRSWESSAMSRAAELPDQNPHKAYKGRDMLLDLKFNDKDHHYYDHNAQDPSGNRHQDRPAGTHHSPRSLSHNRGKERDPLPFKSSGGSEPKWEAEERPNSNSSSTSQESSSDDRREEWKKKQKKHKQEKRQPAPELLEEGELKKHKHKKSKTSKDGGEEESSGEGDDKWKEEEDHSKLYSVMLF